MKRSIGLRLLVLPTLLLGACSTQTPRTETVSMVESATPFLMFQDGNAEEAMAFYVSLFPDGRIIDVERFGPEGPGEPGSVLLGRFEIADQRVMCTDSPPVHEFGFTPSISLFIECESVERMDTLAAGLVDGGAFLMPPDNYGFSERFAWVNDRYGVSWQLNYAGE